MDLFPAADEQQLDYIKRIIDRSDYYVVIVGGRYGSVDEHAVSYTEREFEYAQSKGIPVLAFLHADPGSIAVGKTDEDSDKKARLDRFKAKLMTGRLVESWTGIDELCTKVVIAVANATNLKPGVGWVRGDNAIDPKLLQEFERIRTENAELRTTITELRATQDELSFDDTLIGPDDLISFGVRTVRRNKSGQMVSDTVEPRQVKLGVLFLKLNDTILTEPSEFQLQQSIGRAATSLAEPEQGLVYDQFQVPMDEVVKLRHQLEGQGLVLTTSGIGDHGNRYLCWEMTPKGRLYVTRRMAQRKGTEVS
jgi:hypothetical protein